MREKAVNENAVARLINFLQAFHENIKHKIPFTPSDLMKEWEVARRTFSDMKALGIIERADVDDKIWYKWKNSPPNRNTALKILDYRLKQTKRTVHFPIPDFAAIGESLTTITDRLAHLLAQNEKFLKTAKNAEISNDPADLFRVDDQRLYIAGQIASAIYSTDPVLMDYPGNVSPGIIKATDDLMKGLLNRGELIMPQSVVLIGACKICEKGIYNDEPSCTDGVFTYCKDHMPDPGLINIP